MRWLTNIIATPRWRSPSTTPNSRSTSRQRKRRGRLVHDQDAGVRRKRPGDLDQLLLGAAQLLERDVRIGGEADRIEERRCGATHLAMVDAPETVRRHVAEEDVLGDREVAEEAGVLMHDRDAAAERVERRSQHRCLPIENHRAGIGLVETGEELHAGAFARAVLPKESEDLAGAERQRDVLDRGGAAEGLGRVIEPEDRPGINVSPISDGGCCVADIA